MKDLTNSSPHANYINKVAVIGGGSFGTALAIACSKSGKSINLYSRSEEITNTINIDRTNEKYLKAVYIPENVSASTDLLATVDNADVVFLSVPSFSVEEVFTSIKNRLTDTTSLVNCVKGFIPNTCQSVSDYCEEHKKILGTNWRIAKLAGPNIARELVRDTPSGAVLACKNYSASRIISKELSSDKFRLYHSSDIEAIEMASILKNIYAIGLGFANEFSQNINTQSLLFSRSISEMMQIFKVKNLEYHSLLGLAGIGDFYATCTDKSRNFRLGKSLAAGMDPDSTVIELEMLAEGRYSVKYLYPHLKNFDIYLPIMDSIYGYLFEHYSLAKVLKNLSELPIFQKDVEM